jgi:hypothetical protein
MHTDYLATSLALSHRHSFAILECSPHVMKKWSEGPRLPNMSQTVTHAFIHSISDGRRGVRKSPRCGQQPHQTSRYCSGSIAPPSLSELLYTLRYRESHATSLSVVCELLEAECYPCGRGYARPCTLTIRLDATRGLARRRTNSTRARTFHVLQLNRKD